jgi:triacylglycerol lipase
MRAIGAGLLLALLMSVAPTVFASAKPCVVLLHGLGRTAFSMMPLALELRATGYFVVNQGYPSTRKNWADLAQVVAHSIKRCEMQSPEGPIHFVTHSMGAIVLREYFAHHAGAPRFSNSVLLGPPNHGSEIVDAWGKRWWFRMILGRSGSSLSTDAGAPPAQLPSLPFPFGVIAGNSAGKNLLLPAMPAPHDGKVSVASTKLVGMQDFTTVPIGHTWLPNAKPVRKLVLKFLKTGAF